jgi:ResB-like family
MKSFIKFFGSIRLTVICLLILCVQVVLGTLYQKDYGLHAAQERFFYSWIVMAGGVIPLPGALLVMALMVVNLTVSLFVHFMLGARFVGVWLVHLGLLLMMGGGGYTMLTGKSGYVFLIEGEKTNVMTAYQEWELAVWPDKPGQPREVEAMDANGFKPTQKISFPTSGLQAEVETYLRNAEAYLKADKPADPNLESTSKIVSFKPQNDELEPEANIPLLVATVSGGEKPRRILLYGVDDKPTQFTKGGVTWNMQLQRRREELPVMVDLVDFKREMHAQSSTAKSYASMINVSFSSGIERQVAVEMNQPFRYRGYTFYQASFSEQGDVQGSKFAVTFNIGRLIPYVATAMTTIGLIIHFGIHLVRMAGQQRRSA